MGTFSNTDGKAVLQDIVRVIHVSKDYLSEVDGLIGDGDHGANMNKGFMEFGKDISGEDITFTDGLYRLGRLLMEEIGGSMGPIYGTIFISMAEDGEGKQEIGLEDFSSMLQAGLHELYGIVDARVGDKTLVDTLAPAADSLQRSVESGEDFKEALRKMKEAAQAGRDSTKNLTAKFGRSARLGERSKGVPDAGAVSCCFILTAMAEGIEQRLH